MLDSSVYDMFPRKENVASRRFSSKKSTMSKIANESLYDLPVHFKNGPDRLRRNPDRAVLLIRMNTHSHYILISETTPNFQKLAFYRQLQGKLLVELMRLN